MNDDFSSEKKKAVYMNLMQREVMHIGAKDSIVIAGRGTGKGMLHAATNLRNFQAMPGSTTAIVAPNIVRAKSNTIPSMTMHWEAWGYRKGVHWVIGKRPPKHLGWPAPVIEPEYWENVISFYTGAIAVIISQDRAGTSNSKSFDYIDIDEGKFIKFDQLKDETFQANRGQQKEFGDCPWHHGMLVTSDMPTCKSGEWMLAYEDKGDEELIQMIQELADDVAYNRKRLEQQYIRTLHYTVMRRTRQLDEFRRHALLYRNYPSLVNLPVLGEEYFARLKRDLPALTFQTSVLCLRVRFLRNGFYSSMTEANIYDNPSTSYADNMEYPDRPQALDCRAQGDIVENVPLSIAFDFNRNINWLVVGQALYSLARLNTVKSFYVKYERKLPEVISDFCIYFKPLKLHEVIFYYDSTALGSNYAVNNEDFQWVVCHELERHGWKVTPVYIGNPMAHPDKHLLINMALRGMKSLTPYINEQNNEDLLLSIRSAGVYNGKKDKRGEKLAETEEDRLEARTDGSDAWDTLVIGCINHPATPETISYTSNWR